MLHFIFASFFTLFFNINIGSHTQAHFEHKKEIPHQNLPEIKITNTAHTPAPNIQDLIPNKTVFPGAPKPDNKPPIFVKNPNTGKIEPYIFVAHDQEELKKQITEKYGPLTEEQYQLILSALAPVILIPGIGGAIGGGTAVGGTIGGVIGGIVSGPAIPVITIGIGIYILIKWKKDPKAKNGDNNNKNEGNNNSGNSGNNNNKEPKDKKDQTPKPFVKKHPNGEYKPNTNKHHPNSSNGIGKPPRDSQKALNESIAVPGKERQRIAIQDKKIIALKEHQPGKWHAYIEENFYNLEEEAQQALVDAGWVRSIKSGKIIKGK